MFIEDFLIYNTTGVFGKFCVISVADAAKVSSDWFKNMTVITQAVDKTQEYFSDIESCWYYMIIIAVIAFVVSIVSLIFIRYFAGVFVWITILFFLISLFLLAYFSREESTRLSDIAAEENFETDENNSYYTATNLYYFSWFMYILGGVAVLIVMFSLSTISLSIAVIKSAALYVASNFYIVLLPVLIAVINVAYVILWAVSLAFLWSVGEVEARSSGPFAEVIWSDKTRYFMFAHIFSLLWNVAFINYFLTFVIGCSCAIWYFNNKDSANYFPRPISTAIWWAFRYHLGSLALGAFVLAIIQAIKVMLAYLAAYIENLKKKGIESKVVDWIIKCLMIFVACFERFIKFLSTLGFIQVAISGQNFCTSCFKAFTILFSNPMKFGFVHALGTVFTFIGKLFISGLCGVVGYIVIEYDENLAEELHSAIFPVFVFMGIGYVVATVFFSIYGVAADTVLLCFFWDKEIASQGGRPVSAPGPMKKFYEKYKK